MGTLLRDVSRWGFAITVAAGLSFGARSALAAPAGRCQPDPERGMTEFSCNVYGTDCVGVCWDGGMWEDGLCQLNEPYVPGEPGCCVCAY